MQLMKKARESASFDSFELTGLMHGGRREDVVTQRRAAFERVEKVVGTRDISKLPRCYANLSREDQYEEGLRWGKAAFEDGIKYQHDFFASTTPRYALANSNPFGMNAIMVEPTIEFMASDDEQKAKWLPLTKSGKIVGAYVQTELGHGTFVRGIETSATWDATSDEFIIHSPTISSTKFWPGALGFSCTHIVLVARLLLGSVDHGPHFFIVQVRSLEEGKPIPGIKLGDIGMKMSYNGTCNGFASFDKVRIPRTNMLMGHAKVHRNGNYERTGRPELAYSTLLLVRGIIVRGMVPNVATIMNTDYPLAVGFQLAQSVTIATRYSTVREQGLGPNSLGRTEVAIMSYASQHFRILTLIAKSYAIVFASKAWDRDYEKLREEQDTGDHASLPYFHALTAGLKAWSTQTAADGAEDARKCCGGQGYLMISGLPEIVASVTATATFEGENYVLWQQVGRYLFKCLDHLKQDKPIDSRLAYLATAYQESLDSTIGEFDATASASCSAFGSDFLQRGAQLSIYRHRTTRLTLSVYEKLRSSTKTPIEAWNEHMMSIISAARAHTEYIAVIFFTERVKDLPASTSSALRAVLTRLCSLFALSNIINPQSIDAISFVEDGYFSLAQLDTIRSLVDDLLEQLLPDAVALTDAWDFTDASLCSALGMYDGNVYENLMRWINQLPINKRAWEESEGVYQPGWKKWVEPLLQAKL
ncbi:acyl-CoA dehydrogenase/oxidase C-terminal [Lophiotrema nucula]|uniref:Acyl-coenzyme A oxidase n=1 Tax=Lophiotrema nucula TaxID=690887 RepID=A0A6A5ZDH6_9PLEO|nr:acyl-CoA dehydrogenase/oxidase C-terminal [Lophiotrema nucula]